MAMFAVHRGVTSRSRSLRVALSVITVLAVGVTANPVGAAPVNPSDADIASSEHAESLASDNVAQLAATIADNASAIGALEQQMGGLREAVNKALVDLHDAQTSAELARQDARSAKADLDETQESIERAQAVLNQLARAAYRSAVGAPGVSDVAGSSTSDDTLDRKTYMRVRADEQRQAVAVLDAERTKAANQESLLRKARAEAEAKESAAQEAERSARAAIEANAARIEEANNRRAELVREQALAQASLEAARAKTGELRSQRKEFEEFEKAEAERKAREEEARKAAEERRKAEEEARRQAEIAAAAEAAVAAASEMDRAARQADAQRQREAAREAQAEADSLAGDEERAAVARERAQEVALAAAEAAVAANQPDHTNLDNPYPTTEAAANAAVPAVTGNGTTGAGTTLREVTEAATEVVSGTRSQKIEKVIARAESQLGVTYAWGGGNAYGPTLGIRDGGVADAYGDYKKVGFDCSGLVLYAFAGVGISLPHYSGYQYQRGTKISTSQIQRGDLLFWGPNAEHHVAIYLGNGMMIEAPQSGDVVKKSPVRWNGMSPYAVRLI